MADSQTAAPQPLSADAIRAAIDAIAKNPDDRVLLDVDIEGEIFGDLTDKPTEVSVPGPYGELTIDAFEASEEVKRIFSPDLIRNFVLTKRQELQYMDELSPEERVEIYLDTV